MSWGFRKRLAFLGASAALALGGLLSSISLWAQDAPMAVLQYTTRDLEHAAQVLQTELGPYADPSRLAREKIPELIIPLGSEGQLQDVLDLLETSSGQKVRLAARVPQGGIDLKTQTPTVEINHTRGSAEMGVTLTSSPTRAQVSGIQVGFLESTPSGEDRFVPLKDVPSSSLEFQIDQAKLSAQFELPERGTEIRLQEVQPSVDPEKLRVDLRLPSSLAMELRQGTTGRMRVELNEKAMEIIEAQAEQKTREVLVQKLNSLGEEHQQKIRQLTSEKINHFRSEFALARDLRLPMESEVERTTQRILSEIEGRKKTHGSILAANSSQHADAQSQATAILDELTRSFRLASPENFELLDPLHPQKEGPLYLSTRLALLHSFISNITSDWAHFVEFSGLDPKKKADDEKLRRLRRQMEDLRDHLSSRGSHQELARFLEEWGGEEGKNDRRFFEMWLKNLEPSIRSFIQKGGLRDSRIAESNAQIHEALVRSRLQKTASLRIQESETDLRNQVIAIQGTLSSLNSQRPFQIPGCDPNQILGSSSNPDSGMLIASSLQAVNRLNEQLFREGTLDLLLSKKSQVKLLSPPVITAGRRKDERRIEGLDQGIFTLKVKIEAQGEEFDVELVGRMAPEKDGKAMSLEIIEVRNLDHHPGFFQSIFPVTLLFKVLPIALFGQSFVEGKLEDKKASGENKLVFDLNEFAIRNGYLVQGFNFDPKNLDTVSVRIGAPRGGAP